MIKKRPITPDYTSLAYILQHRRLSRGYTIKQLSKYTGVSVKTIIRYESGDINIEGSNFAKIVKQLELFRRTSVWSALGFDVRDTEIWGDYDDSDFLG